jgi:hypothetical protein
MKRLCILILAVFFFTIKTNGQVGIGTIVPSQKSILDLSSNDKGFLLPRMTTAERLAIEPDEITDKGMQVFDSNTDSIWMWNGSQWQQQSVKNFYDSDGSIETKRIIEMPSGRSISFKTKGISSLNQFSIDSSTFSLDALNHRIGIGTVTPQTFLDISPNSGSSALTIGTSGTENTDEVYINFGTKYDKSNPLGENASNLGWRIGAHGYSYTSSAANSFHTSYWNGSSWLQGFIVLANGNMGIGTSSPTTKLEIDGAATNKSAFNAGMATTIDFSKSNLAYTSASAGNFTLLNIKDGGTYTLAVRGSSAGTANFTSTGFIFKSPNNGPTIENTETLYTFLVMGSTVYFYVTLGL